MVAFARSRRITSSISESSSGASIVPRMTQIPYGSRNRRDVTSSHVTPIASPLDPFRASGRDFPLAASLRHHADRAPSSVPWQEVSDEAARPDRSRLRVSGVGAARARVCRQHAHPVPRREFRRRDRREVFRRDERQPAVRLRLQRHADERRHFRRGSRFRLHVAVLRSGVGVRCDARDHGDGQPRHRDSRGRAVGPRRAPVRARGRRAHPPDGVGPRGHARCVRERSRLRHRWRRDDLLCQPRRPPRRSALLPEFSGVTGSPRHHQGHVQLLARASHRRRARESDQCEWWRVVTCV